MPATSFRSADSIRRREASLTQLIPEPNTAGTLGATGQTINNYLINPIKERQDNQFDVKVDHNLTTNNRFFGQYGYQKSPDFSRRLCRTATPRSRSAPAAATSERRASPSATHTLKSNLLNEFRFGWRTDQVLPRRRSTTG